MRFEVRHLGELGGQYYCQNLVFKEDQSLGFHDMSQLIKCSQVVWVLENKPSTAVRVVSMGKCCVCSPDLAFSDWENMDKLWSSGIWPGSSVCTSKDWTGPFPGALLLFEERVI